MKKMRKATGGGKAISQKLRATALTIQSTNRQNETSVLLATQTALDNGDERVMTSIEMTQLSDGRLTEDRTTLCFERGQEDVIVREKAVQFTEAAADNVASTQPASNTDSARRVTSTSSNVSSRAFDCRGCFTRRRPTENNSDENVVVGSSRSRHHGDRSRHHGDPKLEQGSDDGDDIRSTLMSNDETTSIRTGVSRTPQVAAVIAMAGRRGRRRLGELFLKWPR